MPPADAIIHAGDGSATGILEEMLIFMDWFSKLNYRYKIFIAGNHDLYFEAISHKPIERAIIPQNVIYLNDSGTTVENIKVWGSPVQPKFYNWAFNRKRGAEIKQHWDLIPADTDILITHGPPFQCLDLNSRKEHLGCEDLLHKVNLIKPKYHVFGHIHESYGTLEKNGTMFINASLLDEYYNLTKRPMVFKCE